MSHNFITSFLAIASIFGTAASLSAQAPQQGVARLSIVQGDVNVKRGDSGDLVAAAINAPVLAQDRVQTSPGSRAEIQLDYANVIRLAPNTDLGFADLENHRYQVQLGAGTIIYRVLRDSNAQAEVDTPSVAMRPTQQGEYRISMLDDGSSQISVRSGALEVYSSSGTQNLETGQTMLVRGDSSDPQFQMTDLIAPDQFDDWSANRDRELLASRSYQYVSPDVYGADDLDAYGSWVPSQYGNVWEPRDTGADWAPYSNGRWVSEPYYGWTWIDDEPWGWAPYHYGRWFDNPGHGWCWWPGSIGVSYSWSPAVVGFFGWGGFGVGVGWGGGIGWVALAPFETFHPWWGGGFGEGGYGNYTSINNTNINNINIVNNTNITNIYRNACKKGGAVTAPYNKFGGPNQQFSRATQVQLKNASLFRGRIPVTPTRASSQYSNRQAQPNPRLASAANRQFFQHQAPQSARTSTAQQIHSQQGSRRPAPGGANARPGGFQRVGQPASNSVQRGQAPGPSRVGVTNMPRNSGITGSRLNTGAQNSHGIPARGQPPLMSHGSISNLPQNSGLNGSRMSTAPQSLHSVAPNMRATMRGVSSSGRSTQPLSAGWQRFGQPGSSTNSHGILAKDQAPLMSHGSIANVPQNSAMNASRTSTAPQSLHGVAPNMRAPVRGVSSSGASTQPLSAGWQRFGEPGSPTGSRSSTATSEQSAWHSFGQPQRASGSYGRARPGGIQRQPGQRPAFGAPSYGGNYQSRALGTNQPASRLPQSSFPTHGGGYNYGSHSAYSAPPIPHYHAPSGPRYSAPSTPHYNAPSGSRYSAPSTPHYNAPSGSRYSAPSTPHYNASSAPHYGAPSTPRYNAPSAPHYSAPSTPHYNAPSAPHYSAPSTPHYNAPSAPHYSAPSMPHYAAPSAPQHSGAGGGRPSGDRHS